MRSGSHMRLLFIGALLIAASAVRLQAQPTTQPMTQAVADERILRVEQWLVAASHHEPGSIDDAASAVATWSNTDLRMLWIDVSNLMALMRHPGVSRFEVRGEHDRYATKIVYARSQLARMQRLACAAAGILKDDRVCVELSYAVFTHPERHELDLSPELMALFDRAAESRRLGDPNYILKIGALMHTDIAMAGRLAAEAIDTRPSLGPQSYLVRMSDGQQTDLNQVAVHWELARLLLDDVRRPPNVDKPSPWNDQMVHQWYLATATWMEKNEHLNKVHVNRGRDIFPRDPDILFLLGCLHETFAGAQVQTAIQAAVMPSGVVLDTEDERAELRLAEEALRRAVEARLNFPEAHLRLGRVIALRGRPAEAAPHLRAALDGFSSPDDQALRYYGELFLGAVEAALGQYDEAQTAYEHAVAMYPQAQSPLLGLSELARRRGDRRAALAFIQQVFALPHDEQDRLDPWWTYYVVQARNTDTLLEELWKPFKKGTE
jgi:hypothetical protein